MRLRRVGALGAATALLALAGHDAASSTEFKIFGVREDRTPAMVRFGGPPMPAYGAKLHAEIFREIRRNYLPFKLIAPASLVVTFAVNRKGELVQVGVAQKSRAKPIDDYVVLMVKQAARRFPPAPVDHPDEITAFSIPMSFAGQPE